MIVKVLQHHITKGLQGEPRSCAVARAIHSATGEAVSVNGEQVRMVDRAGDETYELSDRVKRFIEKFDAKGGKKAAKPFSFRLAGLHA